MYETTLLLHAPLLGAELIDPHGPLSARAISPGPGHSSSREDEARQRDQQDRDAIAQVLAAMEDAVRRLETQNRNAKATLEKTAVELGIIVAERLIREKLDAGQFGLEQIVHETVERLGSSGPITVKLHPQDVSLLETRRGGQPLFHGDAKIRVAADSHSPRGSCRAEAEDLVVESNMQAQLAEVRSHLLRSLDRVDAGPQSGQT